MKKQAPVSDNKYEEVERVIQQWRQENPRATLTEIENAIDSELNKLRQKLVEETIEKPAEAEDKAIDCPKCGTIMVKNGQKKRTLRSKGGEKLTLNRQQMRCLQCGMTLFPPG